MILRLITVALNLPQTVILPGQHMVRICFQGALVPDLRKLVVAELAIGISDQIRHIRVIVVAERLQLHNRRGIVSAVVDRRISCAVPMSEGGVVEKGLLGFLGLGGVSGLGARTASGMTKADKRSVGPSPFRGRLRPLDFRYRP